MRESCRLFQISHGKAVLKPVALKPSCIKRGLVGEIIRRIELKGLRLVALAMSKLERNKVVELYKHHMGKPFFNSLVESMSADPVVVLVVEGREAISVVRRLVGATDPSEAIPGTIRGDFGLDVTDNLIHASDSPESYEREVVLILGREGLE